MSSPTHPMYMAACGSLTVGGILLVVGLITGNPVIFGVTVVCFVTTFVSTSIYMLRKK